MEKLVFTKDTSKEQYDKLYQLEIGEVIKIESDYETVMRRVAEYKPTGLLFEVYPIVPGTDLFTMYGPNHSVVVTNTDTTKFIKPI